VAPTNLHHRDAGNPGGSPLLVLHGGWGYAFYPFDRQIEALGERYRFLIPDRTGYGTSPPIDELPPRFHEGAAREMERFLDGMGVEKCTLWGHSDGAVIAAIMALRAPERYEAIVLEALHVEREKPRSRAFFTMMAEDPDGFGERIAAKLAADHGARWREVLRMGGRAWLHIAATPDEDFFDHRLHELRVPTLLVHGAEDPRTEPGELDRVRREVPSATIEMIPGGGHSPHSERSVADETTSRAARWLLLRR
jgi:pimeloyl-ACP methyl ester carboxylesterase